MLEEKDYIKCDIDTRPIPEQLKEVFEKAKEINKEVKDGKTK